MKQEEEKKRKKLENYLIEKEKFRRKREEYAKRASKFNELKRKRCEEKKRADEAKKLLSSEDVWEELGTKINVNLWIIYMVKSNTRKQSFVKKTQIVTMFCEKKLMI